MEEHIHDTTHAAHNHEKPAKKKEENFFKEIIKFTILALIIVLPVRAYIAQPFVVSGASMDPTFETGEYLIVDELSYHFENPSRGQVVIFKFPRDPRIYFIKRIIGLPGETVKITDGQITIVNKENPEGLKLSESYISASNKTYDNYTVTLGEKEYFVMGDNRAASSDSRSWGPLDKELIVGRPIVRLLPVTRVGIWPGVVSASTTAK